MFSTLRAIFKDYKGVFDRDPAARHIFGWLEVLLTYSGFHAMLSHRICHILYRLHIPLLPRFLSQITRFITGIEIHPGAKIGEGFFIDHGMGVVIGETTEIGKNVTIFQGVTLGGTGKEAGKRHPTLEDHVVVGAGAKILGNIRIGKGSKIGAGSVVVRSIGPECTVVGVPGMVVKQKGTHTDAIDLEHGNLPNPIRQRLKIIQEEIDCLCKHCNCDITKCKEHKVVEKMDRDENNNEGRD